MSDELKSPAYIMANHEQRLTNYVRESMENLYNNITIFSDPMQIRRDLQDWLKKFNQMRGY